MAMNEMFDWRRSDRRLFMAAAIAFPLVILAGFGRTYYFKLITGAPPLSSYLVHVHGVIMTAWVLFFIAQVGLIRTKKAKVHMNLGMLGIVLAILVVVVGFFTAAAAAKNGSASAPPDVSPLGFFAVPFFDLVIFVMLFGAAIYFKKRPADHKRLMLLTVISFLPPAIARIPIEPMQALGPLVFFGVPALLAILLVGFDTWSNRKLNRVYVIGAAILIVSYPLRLMISGSDAWMNFAAWTTSWAA